MACRSGRPAFGDGGLFGATGWFEATCEGATCEGAKVAVLFGKGNVLNWLRTSTMLFGLEAL